MRRASRTKPQKALTSLNAVSNSPIFSYSDSFFGHGIVGGPLISVQDYSRQTANIAVRLLRGEAPSDIRMPPVGLSTPKFDWREMQRWGIRREPPAAGKRNSTFATQPHGNNIVYRSWRSVPRFLVQVTLIGWLFYEHRRRHLAEMQSRNSIAELTYMNRRATQRGYCRRPSLTSSTNR